jgi:TorA maturation chaperone TorD
MSEHASVDEPSAGEQQALADVYHFLSLTMRYPDQTQVSDDFQQGFLALLDVLSWKEEHSLLLKWQQESKHLLESLQLEYTRLFINAVPHVIAPPYASVYLDGDGSVQGKSTEKIRDYYRSCGLDIADDVEPPDHLQHQLAFLAELVKEGRYKEEEQFLARFFRPWFRLFTDIVLQETGHPFYAVSIQLIDFFTKEEQ